MAQQAPTKTDRNPLDYLDHPSDVHGFWLFVMLSVVASWGLTLLLLAMYR